MPPLVFLHGLGTGPRGWAPQVEAFAHSREVLTPTLPLDFGDALGALEVAIGDRNEVDLCGLSFGALVALLYAGERPGTVRQIVACAGFVRLPLGLRIKQAMVARTILLASRNALRRQLVAEVPEPYRDEALEDLSSLHKGEVIGLLRRGARLDLTPVVEDMETPVLVLCGERDERNLPLSRALADALPSGEFQTIPDAGHVANLDNPEAFNAAVAGFLGG